MRVESWSHVQSPHIKPLECDDRDVADDDDDDDDISCSSLSNECGKMDSPFALVLSVLWLLG